MRRSQVKGKYLPLVVVVLAYVLAAGSLAWPQGRSASSSVADALREHAAGALQARQPVAAAQALPVSYAQTVSPDAALRALQSRAAGPLEVHWHAQSGIPDFLTGRAAATRLPYTPSLAEQGKPAAIARGFLDENRALFKLNPASDTLQLVRTEPDAQLNYTHVRMAQFYQGLPVFGKQLVVHLDPAAEIVAVNGQFTPNIAVDTRPSLSTQQAEAVALQNLREIQLDPDEQARVQVNVLEDATRLMVYVDPQGRATLTWQVTIMTSAPLGQWLFFVNARRPLVVHAIDDRQPIKRRRTFTAENGTDLPGQLVIDEGERSRDPVAQAAHDGAGIVYDYYFKTFKRDAFDGQGSAMVSTVNYGSDPTDAENAAWIGELAQMIYGDGGRIFKPLSYGLDVVGHEFTHGVIDATAQLIYEGQSGALNESYADVFGAMIDRTNWTIGEQVVKAPPFPLPYLRSLEDPNLKGNYDPSDPLNGIGQPATMDEFANLPLSRRADNGGVHVNSGIPNHAAFLLSQAIGREKTEQIYYRTLTQYLTPDANFLAAANATARAAADLYSQAEVDAVRNAFAQVGINVGGGDTAPTPPSDTGTPPQGQPVPQQPEQIPAGCSELLVSGGFENDEGWTQVVRGDTALIDTELPHTGRRSAWLGGTDQEPLQFIYQDVRVPANATNVTLNYFRLIHEETTGLLGAFSGDARFGVLLANTDGDVVDTIEELSSTQGDDTWREASFDATPLAGKTIRLVFSAENPRGNVSSFFVDDVSLVACTTGSGPATPPVSGQNLVYIQGTVTDADTKRGINGAQVFIMKPGVSASQAADDDNITTGEVITMAVTDGNGFYRSEAAIPRGQTYSAILVARGYRPIVADDGMEVPGNAANPFQVDATMRRSR